MKIVTEKVNLKGPFDANLLSFTRPVFLDIETTGLSAYTGCIYLIGVAEIKDGTVTFTQWFSERLSEEKEILSAFSDWIKGADRIFTYNGTTFDIPFLKSCLNHYYKKDFSDNFIHKDYYKTAQLLHPILGFPKLSQKEVENYFGIERTDPYTGGELVKVYEDYLVSPNEKAFSALLLHNKEDLKNLITLSGFENYLSVFKTGIPASSELSSSIENGFLKVSVSFDFSFPWKKEGVIREEFPIQFSGHQFTIKIPLTEGKLRLYYKDYKNYYYLPKEQMILPKKLADGVPSDRKEKAKKENCFVEKSGTFIPSVKGFSDKKYQKNLEDKETYLDLSDIDLRTYVHEIIKICL